MSWMDSWSRPNKQSATPAPYYLTSDDAKYCSTCGRVIGARRLHQKDKVIKYCSDGCRKHRPGPLDKRIDKTILALLQGQEGSGIEKTSAKSRYRKGDKRIMINMGEIEEIVFQRSAQSAEQGDASTAEDTEESSVGRTSLESVPEQDPTGDSKEAPQEASTIDANQKRQEGQRLADEREKVRRAARRAVVFGYPFEKTEAEPAKSSKTKAKQQDAPDAEDVPTQKCEAVMNGQVVEPSFAKGNWSIRWRE